MDFLEFKEKDLHQIQHLQPEGWPDIISAFREYLEFSFTYPVKLSHKGRIIGLGTSVIFGQNAWLAHIIVDKEFRNRGLGRTIVDYLLASLSDQEPDSISLIATDLGAPVYYKAGFRKVSDYKFFVKTAGNLTGNPSADILPYKQEYYQQIINLDKYITGENREGLLKKYISNAYVIIEEQKISAYYIPGLCEGPILAINPEAGIEMMKYKYSSINDAVVASENHNAVDFLLQNGFRETNKIGIRMILKRNIKWHPESIFSRIGGNYG